MSTKKRASTKKFYKNFFHGILGSSATQLSSYMDTFLASFLLSGSISYLYYANRIFQLPLALFAIALAQVAFPRVLKALKQKEDVKALFFMQKSFEYLGVLLIFASIIAFIFSHEIIALLFGRGHFNAHDVFMSSLLLKAYILGLFPFGVQKLFSLWLYAKFKQKQAAKIAFFTLLISLTSALLMIYFIKNDDYKVIGIALGSSLSAYYLLFASIKEFGIFDFLRIIRAKFWLLAFILLFLSALILFYYKFDIIAFIVFIFDFTKGLIHAFI